MADTQAPVAAASPPSRGDAAPNAGAGPTSEAAPASSGGEAASSTTGAALPRKRSRWGGGSEDGAGGARKSRWGVLPASEPVPPIALAALATKTMRPEDAEASLVRLRLEALNRRLMNVNADLSDDTVDRSPSPEPTYDDQGKRTNTREQRVRNQLMKERQDLLAETVKRVPGFQVPMGLKVDTRIVRKLFIPVDKYPDYNFIGLIIGPRGTTQKRMEKETGAKIAIRGRGSVKMGRRADGKPLPSESEDLHVLITGDRQEDVDRACAMVEKLLIPVEEGLNEHKALQLRELAMYNGTLREEVVCRMCGDRGHRMVDCPQRTSSWKPANVLCGICGANTHPTIDCPRKGQANAAAEINKLEEEFDSFMAEVQGSGSSAPVAAMKSAPLALPAPAAPPPPIQQQMQQPSMFEAPGPAAAPRSESPDGEEMVIDTPQPVSLPTAPGFAPAHFGAARPGFAPTPFGAPPPPPFGPYGAPPPFGAPPPPPFGRPPPFGFAPPPAPFMGFRGAPPPPQQQQQPPQPPQPPQ